MERRAFLALRGEGALFVAALLGAAGQQGYCAAASSVDTLAGYRASIGRASLSIQWGAWTESDALPSSMHLTSATLDEHAAIVLREAFGSCHTSAFVMAKFAWARMMEEGSPPKLLASVAPKKSAPKKAGSAVGSAGAAANADADAEGVSMEELLEMVARTAGEEIDADVPLMEAGLDSLGAVELRSRRASLRHH